MAKMTNIAHPYANALFEIAVANSTLDIWLISLERLAITANDSVFTSLIDNPELREDVILAILQDLSKNSNKEMTNFLHLLILENRLEALPDIYQLFKEKVEKYQNSATGVIQSAYPMSDKDVAEFTTILTKKLGKSIKLKIQVVHELLGGVRILVDDLVIDASVKGGLEKLAAAIV